MLVHNFPPHPNLHEPLVRQLLDTIVAGMTGKNVRHEIVTFALGCAQINLSTAQIIPYFLYFLFYQDQIMGQWNNTQADFLTAPQKHHESDDVVRSQLIRQFTRLPYQPLNYQYPDNQRHSFWIIVTGFTGIQVHITAARNVEDFVIVEDYQNDKIVYKNLICKIRSLKQLFLGTLVEVFAYVLKLMDRPEEEE